MKKVLKWTGRILLAFLIIVVGVAIFYKVKASNTSKKNMALLGEEVQTLTQNNITFRDLNKNGKMDVYENPNAGLDARVDDLVEQMNLEEKAATMFITMIGATPDGEPIEGPMLSSNPMVMMFSFMLPTNSHMIARQKMNSFNILTSMDADKMAKYANTVQKMAERTRLGIPITVATDPRHGTENNPGATLFTPAFSQWPGSLGLAATRDTVLVKEFGDIARQEYRAVGIHLALHPMADLATEPRWARVNGTFGEDAELSAQMTKAYVLGFQGDSLNQNGVACMTKHFSGGGPQKDGDDAHFPYGKDQVYPGDNFAYHVRPFVEGAFPAKTAQIMPYYGIPIDQTNENVAFAFNKEIITGLLRDSLNFDGVVCTDWNIITDSKMKQGSYWGVEDLTVKERVKKVLDAGCDQFGGENLPEVIVELVEEGQIPESRLDVSVKRILRDKFRLGLFDDPYVDEQEAMQITGKAAFNKKGFEAQEKSITLLKNDNVLPLSKGTKIYLFGTENQDAYTPWAEVVKNPEDADFVIAKITTPYDEPKGDSLLEKFFRQGRLYYNEEELGEIIEVISKKPSIVVANLERPTILTEIDAVAKAMIAEFGVSDEALAGVLFGKQSPQGKMPFELPSSWEAAQQQLEDVPYDSKNPLYRYGHGLSY